MHVGMQARRHVGTQSRSNLRHVGTKDTHARKALNLANSTKSKEKVGQGLRKLEFKTFMEFFMQLSYFACNFTMKTNPHQLLVKAIMHNNAMFTKAT